MGVHTHKNCIEDLILRLNQLETNDNINAIIGIIPTAIKSKIGVVYKAMFDENSHLTRFTSMEAAFCHILNRTAEIESTAAITAHIFSILVVKYSEGNLFKPKVIAYMSLLIDQMLGKTKKVEYGSKKDRAKDEDRASGDDERIEGEEGKRGSNSLLGPPGLGFKLTPENDYHMDNRMLTNVMNPANTSDVLNLKYYLSSRNNCGGSRLLKVGIPSSETDATNKAYVDSTIRACAPI
ncbi:hypothetical protein FQA39_LY17638 [Lamprigera yunnana]|nr:hypothetical protein FQA39_LY17638 [Lamprigera yunnana]